MATKQLPSVIGGDLTISGHAIRIETKGHLQIDGVVEGDVIGADVVIGLTGRVVGTVIAQRVTVGGIVEGTVRGLTVKLSVGSRLEGRLFYCELTMEEGAGLDAGIQRLKTPNELMKGPE